MQRLVLWTLTSVVPKYYTDCSCSLWWSLLSCELAFQGPKIKSWFLNGNQFLVCGIWMQCCPQLRTWDLSAAPGLGTESNPCVVSFFVQNTHHSPIFLLKTQWVKVYITCCRPGFTAVFTGDGQQSLERGFLLTTFHTQICLTKRCICDIKVHIFSFAISIHPIKLTNAKVIKIKKCLKFRAIFRSTEDWILPSSARTFSALVVPQQETSGGNMANPHQSKTHGSLKSTELFGCSYVLNPFRPPDETPKFGYFDYGLDVVIGLMSMMSPPFFWKPLRLGFFSHLSLPIKGSGFFAGFLGCFREVPCGNMSLKMRIYCS